MEEVTFFIEKKKQEESLTFSYVFLVHIGSTTLASFATLDA